MSWRFLRSTAATAGLTSCGPRLDLDETEHISVPPDEINFSMMPCRTEIACDHDVTAMPKIEVSVFLAAPSGAKIGRPLRVLHRILTGNAIKTANDRLHETT
jgi:hypothetical protein